MIARVVPSSKVGDSMKEFHKFDGMEEGRISLHQFRALFALERNRKSNEASASVEELQRALSQYFEQGCTFTYAAFTNSNGVASTGLQFETLSVLGI